jgi:hypothetical protein
MIQVAGVYLLGEITLLSEIVLPELPPIQHERATPHPVTIRLGDVSHHLPGAVEVDPDCFATPWQYFLRIQGTARYLVTNGREIVVSPEAGANPLDVRSWLLGNIFVALCHQRGLLPLHGSAVSSEPVNGRQGVAAFLARSGQGKSSLAAHLAQCGLRVLADDVCLIDPTPAGEILVTPSTPWLKLWRNSLQNLGREAQGLERVLSEFDKYRLPLEAAWKREPIRKLVFLEGNEESSSLRMEEVPPVKALPWLLNLTHQAYVLEATGQRQESFLRCGRVLSQARAYRLIRPWGLDYLESTVDAVDKWLLDA